jgi:hypothetical protein
VVTTAVKVKGKAGRFYITKGYIAPFVGNWLLIFGLNKLILNYMLNSIFKNEQCFLHSI